MAERSGVARLGEEYKRYRVSYMKPFGENREGKIFVIALGDVAGYLVPEMFIIERGLRDLKAGDTVEAVLSSGKQSRLLDMRPVSKNKNIDP